MLSVPLMILLLLSCFFLALLNLANETPARRAFSGMALVIAVGTGTFFYGYGYVMTDGLHFTTLVKALLALCRMFAGINDLASIQKAPLMAHPGALALFWLGHFLAFYVTASATIAALGKRLLQRIRVEMLRKGPLLLIYGINEASVAYARHMAGEHHRAILLVDGDCPSGLETAIQAFGGVVNCSSDALQPTVRFLKRLGMRPGSRKLEVAALHEDSLHNLAYAELLLKSLNTLDIAPEQISLLSSGTGEDTAHLQASGGKGYGTVWSFDDYEITARLIMQNHPPCDRMAFEKGRALENFHCVIVGFGRMGQAMLSHLVMNSQFHGSHFRADIFAPQPQNGFLHDRGLLSSLDIRFHTDSGRSDAFYAFLQESRDLQWIALCTGDPAENTEIVRDLHAWYRSMPSRPLIIQATRTSYFCLDEEERTYRCSSIYDMEHALDIDRMDRMAMEINHIYCQSGKTAEEDWKDCSYFSRLSSRASADFFPAMLRAAGRTREQVLAGDWPPDAETAENLAITEHLRWCGFHYAMGFSRMPEDLYEERIRMYHQARAENRPFQIGKDIRHRFHACLIPWEDLDALSLRENEITGGHVDYKQMDRNNVKILADILRASAQEGQ